MCKVSCSSVIAAVAGVVPLSSRYRSNCSRYTRSTIFPVRHDDLAHPAAGGVIGKVTGSTAPQTARDQPAGMIPRHRRQVRHLDHVPSGIVFIDSRKRPGRRVARHARPVETIAAGCVRLGEGPSSSPRRYTASRAGCPPRRRCSSGQRRSPLRHSGAAPLPVAVCQSHYSNSVSGIGQWWLPLCGRLQSRPEPVYRRACNCPNRYRCHPSTLCWRRLGCRGGCGDRCRRGTTTAAAGGRAEATITGAAAGAGVVSAGADGVTGGCGGCGGIGSRRGCRYGGDDGRLRDLRRWQLSAEAS